MLPHNFSVIIFRHLMPGGKKKAFWYNSVTYSYVSWEDLEDL